MAGITKGKQRITLEMEPSALQSLNAFAEAEGTSRGQAVGSLVELFVDLNPDVYGELFAYCQMKAGEKSEASRKEPDGIASQAKEQQGRAYQRLAGHFSIVSLGSEDRTLTLAESGFSPIELSGNRLEVVPTSLSIINPGDTSLNSNLYMAWFMDADRPCDQLQAWRGESLGPLFGFLSNRDDLYVYGQAKASFKTRDDQRACAAEAKILIAFMLSQTAGIFELDRSIQAIRFAWTEVENVYESTSKIGLSSRITRHRSR